MTYSVGRPAPGHRADLYRRELGRSPVFNRPLYGTSVRCECGWSEQVNEPMSRGGRAGANEVYRQHLVERSQP